MAQASTRNEQSGAQVSTKDSARMEHQALNKKILEETSWQNPAIHGNSFLQPYSEVYVQMDYQHQTASFVQEKGKGFALPEAKVETFLKLNKNTSVWGAASYMTGKQYDVKWNSSSDYDLLNPYVLADTLGGDTQRERYGFQGGYATRLDKVLLGAEAVFRAEHEYRDVDPRMRGIVTDLTLRLGTAYEIWKYRLGLGFEGNIYKQTNDVDFYRELGVIPEFQMTGLGTEYSRFSGDKRTLYYKGGGYGFVLSANPLSGGGFYGDANLWMRQYKRMLADLNALPLTQLFYNTAEVTVGWKQVGKRKMALSGSFLFTKRSGDESIVGKSDSQYFPVIGKLTMYKNYLMDAYLQGLYGMDMPKGSWCLMAKAGMTRNCERYVYPERKMEMAKVYGSLEGQWFKAMSKSLSLTVDVDASYYGNISSDILMPYANMTQAFTDMINYKYRFRKANYAVAHAKVRGDYSLRHSQLGLFAELGGGFVSCSESEQQVSVHAAVGITF